MSFLHRFSLFLFSLFPQIQMVALCNSRAMGEADENSDVDLFVIARKGNLWTARFLVTFFSAVLGVRRRNTHGFTKWSPEYIKRTKDKFCLSFFITEEHLNLEDIRLKAENPPPALAGSPLVRGAIDPYLDRWIQTLIPLVNKNHVYERFLKENSNFGDNLTPQLKSKFLPPLSGGHDKGSFLSLLEKPIKKLWLPKTLRTYEKLGKPWWVVISDTMLKFHDNDQRKNCRDSVNGKQ